MNPNGDYVNKKLIFFQSLVFGENVRYSKEQNQTLSRLSAGPLPEKEQILKFQIADYLDDENVIDYLIVYGDEINSLIVQSFAKPAKSKSGISNQTAVLIDAMAAFCRLKSAGDLHKVTTFRSEQNWQQSIQFLRLTEVKSNCFSC